MYKFEKIINKAFPTYYPNEEQLIMESTETINYSSTQNDKTDQIDSIERELTEVDLFHMNQKSKANRINEYQAAWNVTNAIQVIYYGPAI
jgi:hypothetical protein